MQFVIRVGKPQPQTATCLTGILICYGAVGTSATAATTVTTIVATNSESGIDGATQARFHNAVALSAMLWTRTVLAFFLPRVTFLRTRRNSVAGAATGSANLTKANHTGIARVTPSVRERVDDLASPVGVRSGLLSRPDALPLRAATVFGEAGTFVVAGTRVALSRSCTPFDPASRRWCPSGRGFNT
jgi:hypothetical protein